MQSYLRKVGRVPVSRRVKPLVVSLLPVVLALLARSDHLKEGRDAVECHVHDIKHASTIRGTYEPLKGVQGAHDHTEDESRRTHRTIAQTFCRNNTQQINIEDQMSRAVQKPQTTVRASYQIPRIPSRIPVKAPPPHTQTKTPTRA